MDKINSSHVESSSYHGDAWSENSIEEGDGSWFLIFPGILVIHGIDISRIEVTAGTDRHLSSHPSRVDCKGLGFSFWTSELLELIDC